MTAPPTASDGDDEIVRLIAGQLGVSPWQIRAAVDLLDGGATVPFVARYRKEVTGTLDDTQLRTLEERLGYLRELADRRRTIRESLAQQGVLTEALTAAISAAETKARLEDIYLPFRPRRRTRAQIARESGLGPLAEALLARPERDPVAQAAPFVAPDNGVGDTAAALAGARFILIEQFGEEPDLVGELREQLWRRGRLVSAVKPGSEDAGARFADYFAFSEPLSRVPSHRALAVFRGEKEDLLTVTVQPESTDRDPLDHGPTDAEIRIAARFRIADRGRAGDSWLRDTVRLAWRTKLLPSLTADVRGRLRQQAEETAVTVFADNLRDLLLAAPAGDRTTMGLDPGLRTGTKVAVVDGTGKVVATDTVYPHQPHQKWAPALATLGALIAAHGVQLIAIGNGTASRETDRLAAELIAAHPGVVKVVVSEAGASVYSASAYAAAELPGMDVSLRGAVSIARRLQDPLAELVKIDPKSIGVGQYQHDITEGMLARSLDHVVEDCVNGVGVDVNTASVPLLARVSGITTTLAENIVAHRDSNGRFGSRRSLKNVPRLGPKAYEQCAGFLRIPGGDDPLDASAVHPEAYPVVRRILAATGTALSGVIGNVALLHTLPPQRFVDDTFGVPTVTDILLELEKPGRDPRPAFTTATFADGVEKISDLRPGMVLEGVVTNVAAFGAFVDVGVHQDGLVHVSALSDTFVRDPREVVRSGQVVRVKVMEVDPVRKRIGLSLRLTDEPGATGGGRPERPDRGRPARGKPTPAPDPSGSLADALERAGFGHAAPQRPPRSSP
ncbi:MAG: Tex family protein [Nakamurella sp.]